MGDVNPGPLPVPSPNWVEAGEIYVGDTDVGTLTIQDGATASSAYGTIGYAGGNGTVTVTGSDGAGHVSTWTMPGELNVGAGGTASLSILNGGLVSSSHGHIAMGGTASVTVSGVDADGNVSTWALTSNLYVGFTDPGDLTVDNGGAITGHTAYFGYQPNGNGTATVSGRDAVSGRASSLNFSAQLNVGYEGIGELTIEDSGTVQTSQTRIAALAGSTGTLNLLGDASGRGVLETDVVERGLGTATLNLNGGILRATFSQADFLRGFATLAGGAEGVWIDTNNHQVGIGTAFTGAGASASGTTAVQVTNLGGLGALTTGDGIEVISALNGATTTAQTTRNAFRLAGEHVDAGAYEYRLFAADASGAGESWFLRSSPLAAGATIPAYRVEVPLFAALPEQLRLGNTVMLGNWHQRIGEGAGSGAERQTWARLISAERTVSQRGNASPRSQGRLNGLQAGVDLWAQPDWRAGLYVGQLDGDMKVRGFASGIADQAVGRNGLRSDYLGAYATYLSPSGLYADTVLQVGRHRYGVAPLTASAAHGKGDSLLASVEVGRGYPLAAGWVLEPQLQFIHQRIDLDGVRIAGADVQQNTHNAWTVRAGLRLKGELSTTAGRLQPYARLNLYQRSKGRDVTRFTGTVGAAGGHARHSGGLNGAVGLRMRW
ncbi:MAG: autotransporter outer membrane beta-barrel domain-containing protein [Hydrogenophaga sp.]|uniref:autotransporter family protein n=1 Tax=Hydrogenophaga sp. TaxID=1904254 RepID=UPI0025C1AA77|nr:autotransporter outer membrane beta-barrel domain-containing protein [Hydrogenophaga sp.]MBU7574981.1 autotransporter outer membrane beta-barrel domain-containing protein [Hydrogenophaga sp.]